MDAKAERTAYIATIVGLVSFIVFRKIASNKQKITPTNTADIPLVPFIPVQDDTPIGKEGSPQFAKIEWDVIPFNTGLKRSEALYKFLNSRRSVRMFDPTMVPPIELIQNLIYTAATAPSGAHMQPWHFSIIQTPEKKAQLRKIVETQESKNYESRMKKEWVDDCVTVVGNLHSGDPSDIQKPYLTDAPYIIIVFRQTYRFTEQPSNDTTSGIDDRKHRFANYYPSESAGIAAGLFFAAMHNVGLAGLPSTPMGADKEIRKLCNRADNEKVFLLIPVGYPSKDCTVPYRTKENWRKPLNSLFNVV